MLHKELRYSSTTQLWKDTPFLLTSTCQDAFERLKAKLIEEPILALPNDQDGYIFWTPTPQSLPIHTEHRPQWKVFMMWYYFVTNACGTRIRND